MEARKPQKYFGSKNRRKGRPLQMSRVDRIVRGHLGCDG
jgi:hypothetical protein